MGSERSGWLLRFSLFRFFLLRGGGAFLRGVLRKCVFFWVVFRGEVVVSLWLFVVNCVVVFRG